MSPSRLIDLLLRLLFGKSPLYRDIRRVQRMMRKVQRQSARPRATGTMPGAVAGPCRVIDGDTIDVDGWRIRLAGIDAPELNDPWGREAKSHLIMLCRGQVVRAVPDGTVSYQRHVATCYLPDGRDIAAEMVRAGLALDWASYSGGKYRHLEPPGARRHLWRCEAHQNGHRAPSRG